MMDKASGTVSILAGILFFLDAIANFAILLPGGMLLQRSWSEYYTRIAANPLVYGLVAWGVVIPVLLAVAVVFAVSDQVRQGHESLVRWSSTLAIVGYAVAAVKELTDMQNGIRLAGVYVQGDPFARTAIETIGHRSVDPDLVLQTIMTGVWFVVVNGLALRQGQYPRGLAMMGLAYVAASLLTGAALALSIQPLFWASLGLQILVLSPAWFIWIGIELRRSPVPR